VVVSRKQGDELWTFAKLDGSWLAEQQSVSEERLCFMELDIYFMYNIFMYHIFMPKPLVVQSKVCGHSVAGITGLNPAEGMDVCLLGLLCIA
jgi:hypothetical protein